MVLADLNYIMKFIIMWTGLCNKHLFVMLRDTSFYRDDLIIDLRDKYGRRKSNELFSKN